MLIPVLWCPLILHISYTSCDDRKKKKSWNLLELLEIHSGVIWLPPDKSTCSFLQTTVVIYFLMTLSNYTAYVSCQFHANRSFSMLEPLNKYGSYGFASLRDKTVKRDQSPYSLPKRQIFNSKTYIWLISLHINVKAWGILCWRLVIIHKNS